MAIKGEIQFVNEKEWKGKTLYSFKLQDDKTYYRTGTKKPKGVEKGNVVSFEAEENEDGRSANVDNDTFKVVGKGSSGSSGGSSGGGGGSNSADIQYQSARKDALTLVQLFVAAAALKLPAKEAAKAEALEALVDKYTALYYVDIGTKAAVARSKGEDEEAPAEEPDDEDDE